jgi:hypothetical protein
MLQRRKAYATRNITWTHKFGPTLRSIVRQIPAMSENPLTKHPHPTLEALIASVFGAFSIKSVYQELRTTEKIERLNQTMPFDSYVFPLTCSPLKHRRYE